MDGRSSNRRCKLHIRLSCPVMSLLSADAAVVVQVASLRLALIEKKVDILPCLQALSTVRWSKLRYGGGWFQLMLGISIYKRYF
jgi:hypothetical protein